MRILKRVPTTAALRAASDHIDHTQQPDPANAEFTGWYRDNLSDGRSVPSIDVDVMTGLLSTVPDDPAGQAWRNTAEECLRRTIADIPRPYDDALLDSDTEQAACVALDQYAETLRERSPLLEVVADQLEDMIPTSHQPFPLGDATAHLARLTDLGLDVHREPHCDKHDDCRDVSPVIVSWDDLEALVPGVRTHISDLLAAVYTGLPADLGPDDATDRFPPDYDRDRRPNSQ